MAATAATAAAAAAAAAEAVPGSIFEAIQQGDLEGVKRHILADPVVLEERDPFLQQTPLIWAIRGKDAAIALWLVQHRGDHDAAAAQDPWGYDAFYQACSGGLLSVVQVLVAAGADPTYTYRVGCTPLRTAVCHGRADVVAYLLSLPAVRATINAASARRGLTALTCACMHNHTTIVQLLLDAGADPTTLPAGLCDGLPVAAPFCNRKIVALLTSATAEPQRARLLCKARAILDADRAIIKAQADGQNLSDSQRRGRVVEAVVPGCLQGRVERGEALPGVALTDGAGAEADKRRAVLASLLGTDASGDGGTMPADVFVELLDFIAVPWDEARRRV